MTVTIPLLGDGKNKDFVKLPQKGELSESIELTIISCLSLNPEW